MLKCDEMQNPGSCWNRAGFRERVFVLVGRDLAMPETIRFWVQKRIEKGKNVAGDKQIDEALQLADQIEAEQLR